MKATLLIALTLCLSLSAVNATSLICGGICRYYVCDKVSRISILRENCTGACENLCYWIVGTIQAKIAAIRDKREITELGEIDIQALQDVLEKTENIDPNMLKKFFA